MTNLTAHPVKILILILVLFSQCKDEKEITTNYGTIIDKFIEPDIDARPMARMWFPDGGAGASEEGLAMIEKQINDMTAGGMGGVEIAFLADDSNYGNQDAKEIGWGSENWKKVLKQVLKTANAVPQGFKVDITLTAHWPPVTNNIDPNDNEASQEASYAYKKITQADIKSGRIELPLPEMKTEDHFRSGSAVFLFTDKFIAATVVQVAGFDQRDKPLFKLASLRDVTTSTTRKLDNNSENGYDGHPAGIPDRAYCKANGLNYEEEVTDKFGPDPVKDFDGKIDADLNRKRMADWQYIYETDLKGIADDLSASEGDDIRVGDYVIFGNYYQGTGQVMSGGNVVVTYNRCYVTDYFSEEGVQKIFRFWKDHILDPELIALLKENGEKNGTSIFEDSIEMSNKGPKWTYDLLDEIKKLKGYDATVYAPVLTMGSAGSFDDTQKAAALIRDANETLGSLYTNEHGAKIKKWAAGFNYTYRAQAYPVPGYTNDEAALAVDIPEGDNGSSGDGMRSLSSAVNMCGGKMLSMEATTFAANINSKWGNIMKVLNGNFSNGINRVILHGSAFARAFNGFKSDWPGWNFFKHLTMEDLNGGGFSSWNGRQPWWQDAAIPTGYIARTQAVLQNGKASIDLAVVGSNSEFGEPGMNLLSELLDKGYSYNIMSHSLLLLENAVVRDGVFAPEGGSFKALVLVSGAADFNDEVVEKVKSICETGFPVLFNTNDVAKSENAVIKELISGKYSNVAIVVNQSELLEYLVKNDILPAVSYNQKGLEASHRIADEGDYYYFFNDYDPDRKPRAMPAPQQPAPEMEAFPASLPPAIVTSQPAGKESEGFKYKDDVGHTIQTMITMTGNGTPYILDAWSCEIKPVAVYTQEEGKISMDISLIGREAMIVCIAKDVTKFPDTGAKHVTGISGGNVDIENGKLVHKATETGTFQLSLSDNTKKSVEVTMVPETVELTSGWYLKLLSFGPAEKGEMLRMDNVFDYSVDPTVSEIKQVEFEGIHLRTWNELPATKDQLTKLGVSRMEKVSGIGYYSTTFELPETWNDKIGAYIQIDHNSDMIAEIVINGVKISNVNQISDLADVKKYLKKGENSITIKLDSTLQNRDPAAIEKTTYGLNNVKIIPYYTTEL
jgi:hypothetical protein